MPFAVASTAANRFPPSEEKETDILQRTLTLDPRIPRGSFFTSLLQHIDMAALVKFEARSCAEHKNLLCDLSTLGGCGLGCKMSHIL